MEIMKILSFYEADSFSVKVSTPPALLSQARPSRSRLRDKVKEVDTEIGCTSMKNREARIQ